MTTPTIEPIDGEPGGLPRYRIDGIMYISYPEHAEARRLDSQELIRTRSRLATEYSAGIAAGRTDIRCAEARAHTEGYNKGYHDGLVARERLAK